VGYKIIIYQECRKIMSIKAVIFDLDGVIVSTDQYHYKAWAQLAYEEEIYFDKEINERLRGVSRTESLEIILSGSDKQYTTKEKEELAARKNRYYRVLLESLSPADILPGVMKVLDSLKSRNIKIAIGSSSKNTRVILNKIGLKGYFDAVADGCDICKSKPDPEVFLLAAERLNIAPKYCMVVEDADAGIEAALAAGMKVVGVGFASANKKAHYRMKDLTFFRWKNA
jgi:beta-phosphoglucomutase